jgi:dipeptide/tripeptide permease
MSNQQLGFVGQVKSYPRTFWVANTMEIFERMAWYGMFTPLPLYLTDARNRGGLGMTEEDAGLIIGIVMFLLYLMPVVTGALADRYGYKKMFVLAYGILTPCYWLLGKYDTFTTFLFGFLLLAVGAAIFKPVVVGTVARTTTAKNSQLGFGIFYMIVNVGGFVGPFVSGLLRSPDPTTGVSHWPRVFGASAVFIAVNFLWVSLFYREPTTEAASGTKRTLRKVLTDAVEVLGNVRFFVCVFGMIIAFFAAGKRWIAWPTAGGFALIWLVANLVYDMVLRGLRGVGADPAQGFWALKPMRLSNWRFAVYLLILSGFWTSFNQIIGSGTLVWYIRDFTETRPLFDFLSSGLRTFGFSSWAEGLAKHAEAGGQVNPEWISNLDPLAIVIFQIAVSLFVARVGRFPGIITGIVVAGIGVALPALAGGGTVGVLHASGWLVVLAVFIFALGEMAASPASQEYIGSIAPPDKVALYMGYYFVAVSLGNLFGNVLAGQLYGALARDRGMPQMVWLIFGALLFVTAVALGFYNRYAVPRPAAQTATT